MKSLTDRQYWQAYWAEKEACVTIGPKHLFHKWFRRFADQQQLTNAIEVGGFPGYFSIYLAKYLNIRPTLLDFYIDRDTVDRLARHNGVSLDQITLIEADFLTYQSDQKYDLVFSCGLIEHFDDFAQLIERHADLLAPGGRLFIEIPNFRGVNGLVQRLWDPANLAKHNLECMIPTRLTDAVAELPLGDVQVSYDGRYGTWIERYDELSEGVQMLYRSLDFMGRKVSRLIPIANRWTSPYIVLTAVDQRKAITPLVARAA